jgi:hypothetical protein
MVIYDILDVPEQQEKKDISKFIICGKIPIPFP